MKPWTYRPAVPEDLDWEDNAISNTMAWASHKFLPNWCSSEHHWTSRVTGYLWTECYCCSSFRWLMVGGLLGFGLGILV